MNPELTPKQISDQRTAELRAVIDNGGYSPDGILMDVRDALNTADNPLKLKRIYTEYVQQAIQPELIGTRLLQTIRFDELMGESVSYKYIGAGNIPNVDRSEGQEYPEFTLAAGSSATIRAQFKERGLVVKITDEMIRYNQWDVIRLHITEAARALARAKEKLIFEVIENAGAVVFDNLNPGQSIKGVCTGRDIAGNKNGSITQSDLIEMYSQALANGYVVNTILLHPWAYPIFQKDPMLRHQGFLTGNPRAYLNSSMSPANAYKNGTIDTWRKQSRDATGNAVNLAYEEETLLSTGANSPFASYSPLSGIGLIVSHMVPFDKDAQTTSIIMLDSTATAVLNQKVPLTVDTWEEVQREIRAVRVKETYSIDVIDQGKGIVVAKNIPLVPNELYIDPIVTITDLAP